MEIFHAGGHDQTIGIGPGALTNTITRVHRISSLSAQISVPAAMPKPRIGSQLLTVRIGTLKPTQIAAITQTDAGDEHTHFRRFIILSLKGNHGQRHTGCGRESQQRFVYFHYFSPESIAPMLSHPPS